jgi:rhodanese-related sulfurtransferase
MTNSTWIALGLVILVWLALTRLGKVSGAKARELVAAGAKLVDVRTEAEFAGGHLQGAENVPLDRIRDRGAALAAEGRPVVVYCASGMRSANAKRILKSCGVGEVHDLGGMGRW